MTQGKHLGATRDRDFYGNGPAIDFTTSIEIAVDPNSPVDGFGRPNSLLARTSFATNETVSNWSQALATTANHLVSAPRCWELAGITSVPSFAWNYVDTDHARDKWVFTTGLVQEVDFRGDTSNNDIGRCTPDDTKYTVKYRPAQYLVEYITEPQCLKADGSLPDVNIVNAQTLTAALQTVAAGIAMRLHNVDLSQGEPRFLPGNNSFFEYLNTRDDFAVLPFSSGRYVFYIDDMNSTSVSIVPSGGGWLISVSFESGGTEIRSSCNDMLITPGGDFIDPATLTHEEIVDGLDENLFTWVLCELGNEVQFDLGNVTAGLRIFPHVDSAGNLVLRPAHPDNPWRDVFIDVHVLSQSGPCHENVLAVSDDCMEIDELSLELQSMLSASVGQAMATMLGTATQGPLGDLFTTLTTLAGIPTTGLISAYVDSEGALVALTE